MASHHGACHCGSVQFDVETELTGLVTCNCSICGRTGSIMVFVPATSLTTSGDETMTDYQFGKKSIHHVFCSMCGVRPFARGEGRDGNAYAMINVRCLDGVDVHALEISTQFDGKAL